MTYLVMVYLNRTKMDLPIRVKGEEAEKSQPAFNIEYVVYNKKGEKIKEGVVEGLLAIELRGKTIITPPLLSRDRNIALSVFVDKGEIERIKNILIIK